MPRRLCYLLPILMVVGAVVWPVPSAAGAAGNLNSVLVGTPIRSVLIRQPQGNTGSGRPLQILLALHGMGGNGEDFSKDLLAQADKYGWLLVAPTIDYGDWTNPAVVTREEPVLIRTLNAYLDQLPQLTGLSARRSILVLGHSRGAQLAHRFAEFRPDRVLAVAALSAGTYTLPVASTVESGLNFPFGLSDLAAYSDQPFDPARFDDVQFWVGVGGQDTNPADVPRQWDTFEGSTRVERARAFEAAMDDLGATSVLRIFPDARHEVTSEMRQEACAFLGWAASTVAP